MDKKAFTLVEVLLAMTVVGIIAAVTLNSLGNISANKTKTAFQNNYKHMTEVINAIVTDETIYPVIAADSHDWTGKLNRVTMCNYDPSMFPREFLGHTKVTSSSSVTGGFSFDTSTGALWVVRRNPSQAACSNDGEGDYVIIFDVNGLGEGTNCPYTGSTLSTEVSGTCSNPDTFKFLIGAGNRTVVADNASKYNSSDLNTYMSDNNYLNFNY